MGSKKIVIVGAGPAGLFAAYKLATDSHIDIKIEVVDSGGTIEQRILSKDVLHGVGGAGLMSDGKLIFDTRVGNNLGEILSLSENQRLTNEVEKIFGRFEIIKTNSNQKKIKELEKKALQYGIDFIYPKQSHIGTDRLIPFVEDFQDYLIKRGVNFSCNREIEHLSPEADFFIIAPGRVSGETGWMERFLQENIICYTYRPVDIGVRIEVPSEIIEEITNITRDIKFYLKTDRYQDKIRTFCTCPNGFVGQEVHYGFKTVNGHSESGKSTENTNFALLITIPLTEPLTNSNQFAKNISLTFHDLSGGKTLAQRWGDLIRFRRSKESKQKEYLFQPTLKDITWGDLALAMPARYLTDIIEGIQKLDKIIPGLSSDSTILHAPEIKFHGLHISTNEYLKAENRIYVAGDGSGFSRGIVGAAASGLRAAEGVLKELS
ncbi:MAG: FAD-dependent oxidoreductase [Candidatus Pacearchaeota archaeon]|nr:FAD-dependent oxidoreductase [Candidatus Pacearchaeota archaeon]